MMKKTLTISAIALVITALGLLTRGYTAPSPAAQETINGDWSAKVKQTDQGLRLWISLNRNTDKRNGGFQMNTEIPLQDFTGLNPNANSNVQFTLRRESGVVLFEGLFKDGRGVGDFRFTPDAGFASTMRNLGYGDLSVEKLFLMTMHDVGLKFINELKSLGYDKIPVNKLITMRIHGVDENFIRGAESMGYKDMPVDKLITMRIHNIDQEYVNGVTAMGYSNIPFDKLVAMRIHGVDSKFVKEMGDSGYNNISVDKLIAMRIHGVDSKFVKEMKDHGFSDLSVDDLIKLRIHGVDGGYVRRMRGNR